MRHVNEIREEIKSYVCQISKKNDPFEGMAKLADDTLSEYCKKKTVPHLEKPAEHIYDIATMRNVNRIYPVYLIRTYGSLHHKRKNGSLVYEIFLNKNLLDYEKGLTIAHELGHQYFIEYEYETGLRDILGKSVSRFLSDQGDNSLEEMCDIFADNLLVPKKELRKIGSLIEDVFSIEVIDKIASYFSAPSSSVFRQIARVNMDIPLSVLYRRGNTIWSENVVNTESFRRALFTDIWKSSSTEHKTIKHISLELLDGSKKEFVASYKEYCEEIGHPEYIICIFENGI